MQEYRVIALISVNIVPSWDIEGRELASVRRYHNEGQYFTDISEITGERGGSVVECRTPEREVRGSRPTAAVLCP